jgi:hypothetical protein
MVVVKETRVTAAIGIGICKGSQHASERRFVLEIFEMAILTSLRWRYSFPRQTS